VATFILVGFFLLTLTALVIARVSSTSELSLPGAQPKIGPSGELVLEYGPRTRAFGTLFPVCLAAGVLLLTTSQVAFDIIVDKPLMIAGLWTAVGAASIPSAFNTWVRVIVTEDAVSRQPLLGRRNSLPWSRITKIGYSRLRAGIVLRADDGRPLRVEAELRGFSTFADLVKERLPALSQGVLPRYLR
jgi:hypothetical protein